jgi:hypothetical protein
MESQQTQNQDTQKEKHIGWHVIAFLDLLGQQDALRKITALPNLENQEEVDVFKRKVGELYAPLYALRSFFATGINAFIKGGIDRTDLTAAEQQLLEQFRTTPIFYRHFSDSLIVHIPIRSDLGRFQCRAIYGVLAATAQTFLSCMSKGGLSAEELNSVLRWTLTRVRYMALP